MISVIIPIYNVEKYLGKCLDSVKNQTYQDFEVLLIDDGSTDNSGKIAKAYLSDARFHYIYKANSGQGAARNVGIDMAKGEYLCFIDSDDFVEPNYLEVLYRTLKENGSDISQCSVNRVWEDGRTQLYHYTGNSNQVFRDIKSYLKESSFVMWNKLFRKGLFENLRFPVGIKFEDFALAPQVYSRAKVIASTATPLYHYLWRDNSTTTKTNIQLDILRAQKVLEESCFGKENLEIVQSYFVRQVMCSLLWAMASNQQYAEEFKSIMLDGLRKYPAIEHSIKSAKIDKVRQIWCKLMIGKHFRAAVYYVKCYDKLYSSVRFFYRLVR